MIFPKILIDPTKAIAAKLYDWLWSKLMDKPPTIYSATVKYMYSHYDEQGNHLVSGGETKIYQSQLSVTIYNDSKDQSILRDVHLNVTINGRSYRFNLYDLEVLNWKKEYNLPPKTISSFSWIAMPEGH